MEPIKCPSCGGSVAENAKFCEYCGTNFKSKLKQINLSDNFGKGFSQVFDTTKDIRREFMKGFGEFHKPISIISGIIFVTVGIMIIISIIGSIFFFRF